MAADEGCFVGLIAESEQFVGAVACLTCWICACRGSTLRFGLEADSSLVDRCSYYEHAWIVGGCLNNPPSLLFGQFLEYDSVTLVCPSPSSNWNTVDIANRDC